MNREIKFRGKGIEEYHKDTWYYGSYFKYNEIIQMTEVEQKK